MILFDKKNTRIYFVFYKAVIVKRCTRRRIMFILYVQIAITTPSKWAAKIILFF